MTFRLWSKNSRNISEMFPIWGLMDLKTFQRSVDFLMRDPAVLCKNTWVLINSETKIQWTVEFVQLESNFQSKLTSLRYLGSKESVSA